MQLTALDWTVIGGYAAITLAVGLWFARRAGQGIEEFFLSGRKLPWWLLGTSMVATTFSTDTPNLVTDIVRTGGVSGNWVWWAFLLTGMCTACFYAQLWRRLGVVTDIAFYELRYSGRPAAFLRGFRAVYLGVFFNVMIMASVTLAAIKIAGVLLGAGRTVTVVVAGLLTAGYAVSSGLWGVVVTDVLLFVIAMCGSVLAAWFALAQPEVGGLSGLVTHPAIADRLAFVPAWDDWRSVVPVLLVPLAVQWWSTWYPGSEPGGGGYVAQRMLAARSEADALRATLWFNVAHYALRPWPWILVALSSLAVYPTLDAIQARFPHLDPAIVRHDLAYPAMLALLPSGALGFVLASLAAAYMSTMSTHLNWGASYLVDDLYARFVAPGRSDRQYVAVARLATVLLSALAMVTSLWLENALQAFQILLQIGAGTGAIFLLRWFWWRISAWSEIAAMVSSFAVAVYFQFIHARIGGAPLDPSWQLLLGVAATTAGWVVVTFLTPPTSRDALQAFYDRARPAPAGWRRAVDTSGDAAAPSLAPAFACWGLGCAGVYATLFGTGYLLYGRVVPAIVAAGVAVLAGWRFATLLPRVVTGGSFSRPAPARPRT